MVTAALFEQALTPFEIARRQIRGRLEAHHFRAADAKEAKGKEARKAAKARSKLKEGKAI
jgi:hypothetical protein